MDETTLVLRKGDIVEVLDSDLPSKWFIRTAWSSSSTSVGWVSPAILERLLGEGDDVTPPVGRLVHASSMPQLGSNEGKSKFSSAKAFGSHDLQSLQVCVLPAVHVHHVRGHTYTGFGKKGGGGSILFLKVTFCDVRLCIT